MYTQDLIIRGYVERCDNLWVAVCVDLPLAAQSETPDGAAEKLNEQIVDYINEAFSEREYAADILTRKAPISHRIKFRFYKLLWAVHAFKSSLRPFISPMPVKPCRI